MEGIKAMESMEGMEDMPSTDRTESIAKLKTAINDLSKCDTNGL